MSNVAQAAAAARAQAQARAAYFGTSDNWLKLELKQVGKTLRFKGIMLVTDANYRDLKDFSVTSYMVNEVDFIFTTDGRILKNRFGLPTPAFPRTTLDCLGYWYRNVLGRGE